MTDLRFESTLSIEKIEDKFKDVDVFSGIMDGLQEALAYEEGKAVAERVTAEENGGSSRFPLRGRSHKNI